MGADYGEFDERAALCCAKKGGQDQGQARARQVGHSGGARARSRSDAAVCGPAFNDAPSYRAAEAPIGREVQREVLTGQEGKRIAGNAARSTGGVIPAGSQKREPPPPLFPILCRVIGSGPTSNRFNSALELMRSVPR